MNISLRISTLAAVLAIAGAANAATVQQSISVNVDVAATGSNFDVAALSPSGWPTSSQSFTWNASTKTFSSPASIGFKVKSSAAVTVLLSAPVVMKAGLAEIPVKVNVTSTTSGYGTSAANLGQTAVKIYDSAAAGASSSSGTPAVTTYNYANYTLDLQAQTTNLKDATGAALSTGVPAAGQYSGTVVLVFESQI